MMPIRQEAMGIRSTAMESSRKRHGEYLQTGNAADKRVPGDSATEDCWFLAE